MPEPKEPIHYYLRHRKVVEQWLKEIYPNIKHPCRQVTLSQWSCGWDVKYLQHAYKRAGKEFPFGYKQVDIKSIVTFCLASIGQIRKKGTGEQYCAKKLGIIVKEKSLHNALYDAQLAGQMLEIIARRISKCEK